MTLKLHIPAVRDLRPRLTVFGVGGAGGNAVNNMIARSLEGIDFVVANTDAQALTLNNAVHKLQLGEDLTEGLGAGAKPEVGAAAAEESLERIVDLLKGSHMCFITAGMGGGTGTGAAPIIAQAARELGILTIGVVTKPFTFEGARRMKQAEAGIAELQKFVDTLIIIPNQNLFLLANENTTFTEAFGMADDVLYQGVKGVTDLMVRPGLVNLDFADIRSVMDEMGKAMMGTGEAEGEDRAILAAERAIDNPLLDEISLRGARGVLINITGGDDLSLFEIDEASNKIREQVDPEANIIFGATKDPAMTGKIRVSVVATGIDTTESAASKHAAQAMVMKQARETIREAKREDDLFASLLETSEPEAATPSAPAMQTAPAEMSSQFEYSEENFSEMLGSQEQDIVEPIAATQPTLAPVRQHIEPDPQAAVLSRMQIAASTQRQAAPITAVEAPKTLERQSRFGIDSMIRRMSGVMDPQPNVVTNVEPTRSPQLFERSNIEAESAPQSDAHQTKLTENERERVDIPAFLRRQAN